MDPRLLRHYNEELRYLRELGAEFAGEFPKIAGRLGMDATEVADPYVERLLEGAAFLTARVQLKLDAEFPRLTQRLLETLYPNFVAPVPAMLVAQVAPRRGDPGLALGPVLPRGSVLTSGATSVSDTPCRFTTTQDVRLWPVQPTAARYAAPARDLPAAAAAVGRPVRATLRLRLTADAGVKLAALDMDTLRLHFNGTGDQAYRLHELLSGACCGVTAGSPGARDARLLGRDCIRSVGFDDSEAMLPVTGRAFAGLRLMQEYFAFPARFLFLDVVGLRPALAACAGNELELTFLLAREERSLDAGVAPDDFRLNCVPAVNLFAHRAERIHVNDGATDFQVVADRTRPVDYEIHSLPEVRGFGDGGEEWSFEPLFAPRRDRSGAIAGFYSLLREPRLLSEKLRREGNRSGYIGSEVFISLVDPAEAPWPRGLRQVAVAALCTNRDLPLFMALGSGTTDLKADADTAIESIRVVAGPSRPGSALRDGDLSWRLVDHLSANSQSLLETSPEEGAAGLRALLAIYAETGDPALAAQVQGLRRIATRAVVRRAAAAGPIAFQRGVEATVQVDELAFEGRGAFLFGSVLARYLARYVGMNSFMETVLVSTVRGEVMRWQPAAGARPML